MRGFFARAFQAGWGKKSMRGFRTDLAMECIDEGGGRVEGARVGGEVEDGVLTVQDEACLLYTSRCV